MFRKLLVAISAALLSSPLASAAAARSAARRTGRRRTPAPAARSQASGYGRHRPDQRERERRPCRSSRSAPGPSSTLSPDSRPAARLPTPMPMAGNVVRTPIAPSLEAHHLACRTASTAAAAARRGTRNTRCRAPSATACARCAGARRRPTDLDQRVPREAAPARRAGDTRGMPKLSRGADDGDRDQAPGRSSTGARPTASNSAAAERPCRATIATNVLISSRPLARDSSRSGSISGRMPYFAGLKNVACIAIRNSTT